MVIDGFGRWLNQKTSVSHLFGRRELVLTPRTYRTRRRPSPLKEGPCNAMTSICDTGSPTSPKGLWSFTRVNVHCTTEEHSDLSRNVRHRSEWMLTQGDPTAVMAHC